MERFVVFLRGINVGGNRMLPMAALRQAARDGGFPDCVTYIQSGNLVLSTEDDAGAVEGAVEALVERAFGLSVEAIARAGAELARLMAANPFPHAAAKSLHLCLTKHPPQPDAPAILAARAQGAERIALAGNALWIDFAGDLARSKLTPAALDKAAGSTLTARNLNTIRALVELADG